MYSDTTTQEWASAGCKSAGIGCLECKQPVIDSIVREQAPMLERAAPYVAKPQVVREIIEAGTDKARAVAQETMREVRGAMGLVY